MVCGRVVCVCDVWACGVPIGGVWAGGMRLCDVRAGGVPTGGV